MDDHRIQWNNLYDRLTKDKWYFNHEFKSAIKESKCPKELLLNIDEEDSIMLYNALDRVMDNECLYIIENYTENSDKKSKFQEIINNDVNFVNIIGTMKKIVEFYTDNFKSQLIQCIKLNEKSHDMEYFTMLEQAKNEYCSDNQETFCATCNEPHSSHNNVILEGGLCNIMNISEQHTSSIVKKAKSLTKENKYIHSWRVLEVRKNGKILYKCTACLKSEIGSNYLKIISTPNNANINESINLVAYEIIKHITGNLNSAKV